MEKEITIKTEDNKILYGTLNSENNETLAIFVHGLTGNQNEHIFFNAKKLFPKKGIDTFRFNLYDWRENARQLAECDLHTHAKDIDLIVNKFKKEYEQIVLIGHSFGGPSILFSKQEVEATILWDPSIELDLEKESIFIKEINKYILNGSIQSIINKSMIETSKETTTENLMNKIKIPTAIMLADKGILKDKWMKANIKDNKNISGKLIEGAGHCFDEENTEIKLFAKTIEFIHEQTIE